MESFILRKKIDGLLILFYMICNVVVAQQGGSLLRAAGTYSDKPVSDELKRGNKSLAINGLGNYVNSFYQKGGKWSITPQVSYLIANGLLLGVQGSIGKDYSSKKTNAMSNPVDFSIYSFAPEMYSRYYATNFRVKPLCNWQLVIISSGAREKSG